MKQLRSPESELRYFNVSRVSRVPAHNLSSATDQQYIPALLHISKLSMQRDYQIVSLLPSVSFLKIKQLLS